MEVCRLRLISDILEYTGSNGIEPILFSVDSEKAFDSIDHTFLFSALKSCRFGHDLIHWVKTLFNSAASCVMTLARLFSSQTRNATRRPLSAYLFILALEVMLIQERSNWQTEGVKINDFEVKLSAYADVFALDIRSVLAVLDTFKTFQEFSLLNGTRKMPGMLDWCR